MVDWCIRVRESAMIYEHLLIDSRENKDAKRLLDQASAEGWELVTAYFAPGYFEPIHYYVLRRPKLEL